MGTQEKERDGFSRPFGERLRTIREGLDLSRQSLATRVEIGVSTLQRYEEGWLPKGNILVALSQEIGCSLDWLLFGTGSMRREVVDLNDLGGRLRMLFAQSSPREIEQRLGLSPERVQALVAGDEELGLELAQRIAMEYNVRVDWLLYGEGPMRPGEVAARSSQANVHDTVARFAPAPSVKAAFAQDIEAMEQALRRAGASDEEIKDALLTMARHYRGDLPS